MGRKNKEKEDEKRGEEDRRRKADEKEKQLYMERKRLEENQKRLEKEERTMEEEEDDKRIEELEKRLELKKTEEPELILKEEKKAPMKIEEERKRIEEEAAESLQQIMAVKQQLQQQQAAEQKKDEKKKKPDQIFPTKVVVVNSNSFVPQKNRKDEIGVIKMGSPSQIRRAVKLEAVNIEESEPSSKAEIGREPVGKFYQITEVPTTSFEIKKPQTYSETEKKYSITKVPTSTVVLEQMTKTYAENVAKYSET